MDESLDDEVAERQTRHMIEKNIDPQRYVAPLVAHLELAIESVACGEEHALILEKEGKIFAQGSNAVG